MIDISAPIIPHEGIAGIKLYSKLEDIYEKFIKYESETKLSVDKYALRVEIGEKLTLLFCNANGKLYGISANDKYKGRLLDKIYPLMQVDEVLRLEPSFEYDDWEELYLSKSLCISFKKDWETGEAFDIFVMVKEAITMGNNEFWEGNW